MKESLCFGLILLLVTLLHGQQYEPVTSIFVNKENRQCISEEDYKEIEAEMSKNRSVLGLCNEVKNIDISSTTSLNWPLRQASASNECDYYYISAFVDLDSTSGILDWNCGARTYDGHRGIDIVPWPFIWDKMDHDLVEVIAAAPGTIIARVDGNSDRVCNGVGGGSTSNNYISIQHADGSIALYVHMKTGSLTAKTLGQTVNAGEYLGIVGSAGQSTGVHLHFEVRSDGTFAHYIDPFYGTCNSGIGSTWWASQKPYVEPKLVKLSLHTSWPSPAVCPNTVDTTYEQDVYNSSPGLQATFYASTKHVSANDQWNFRILNPDSSIFDSWNYTALSNRTLSSLGWSRALPTNPGVYTYEGTYNSMTCKKSFTILSTTDSETLENSALISVYPNPTNGKLFIDFKNAESWFKNSEIKIIDTYGRLVYEGKLSENQSELTLNLQNGLYHYSILSLGLNRRAGNIVVFN